MSLRRKLKLAAVVLSILTVAGAAHAQQGQAVETATAEVFKKVGNSVIIKNEDGELKMYHAIPDGVKLFVDDKPAELSDLREGMILRAIRFENAPEPVSVSLQEAGGIATEEDAAAVAAAAAAVAGAGSSAEAAAAETTPATQTATPEAAESPGGGGLGFSLVAIFAIGVVIALIVKVVRRG